MADIFIVNTVYSDFCSSLIRCHISKSCFGFDHVSPNRRRKLFVIISVMKLLLLHAAREWWRGGGVLQLGDVISRPVAPSSADISRDVQREMI